MKIYTESNRNGSPDFRPRAPFVRVSRKHPCPACGKSDNCSVSGDGRIVYCRRVPGDRQGRDGGWTHFLSSDAPPPTLTVTHGEKPIERADADHLDAIFSTMLRGHLVLSEQHTAALRRRGLSTKEIARNGYRSMPTLGYADAVARALEPFDLRGAPGFFRDSGRWRLNTYGPSILIPARDSRLRIRGFQVRLDEGMTRYLWLSSGNKPEGTSSGAPIHFVRPYRVNETGEAVITEGALKADVISSFLKCGVVGVPGVGAFNEDFGAWLKSELPELRRVVIAYDADWRWKPQVRAALEKLMKVLSRAGIRWVARTWTGDAKGYDDHLLAASIQREQEVAA